MNDESFISNEPQIECPEHKTEPEPPPAPPVPKEPVVVLTGLRRSYGTFEAVCGVDLTIYRREIFSLLGPNGSGKTTTIRMLMGLLAPSAGTATIQGFSCFKDREKVMRHVGYVPDEPIFYDYLRGSELISFCAEMRGMDPRAARMKAQPMAERFEIADALEEYAVNYSRGMKKKLALICALLHDPEVLILDEPTNGLDPFATRALHDMLRSLRNEGRTVFFSTHILDQAEKLSDRVGIFYKGKLAAVGEMSELRASVNSNSSLEEIFFLVAERAQGSE